MIARKDAEATSIDRQCFMQSEFARKIGDGEMFELFVMFFEPALFRSHIGVEIVNDAIIKFDVAVALDDCVELSALDLAQEKYGMVIKTFP